MSEVKIKKEQETKINTNINLKTENNNDNNTLSPTPPSDTATSLSTTTDIIERNTVTSSSPNQTFNSQVYHQQLQEAIMAFDSHGMSQNLMAAAAAAIAATVGVSANPTPPSIITPTPITTTTNNNNNNNNNTTSNTTSTSTTTSTATAAASLAHISNTTTTPTSTITTTPTIVTTSQPESNSQASEPAPLSPNSQHQRDLEIAKRESIRTANRERKKKWRLHNEERNKDNDLRCRVNKRANKLFGIEDSEAKRQWVEEEFTKRREKRQEKERRKDIVNNVLSVPQNQNSPSLAQQQQTSDDLSQSFAAYPAVFDASKILEIPSELQRHLLEQLNLALTNSKLPTTSIDFGQQTDNTNTTTSDDTQQQHNETSQSLTNDNTNDHHHDTSELEAKVTQALLPQSSSTTSETMDIDTESNSKHTETDVKKNEDGVDMTTIKNEQSNVEYKENYNNMNMNMNMNMNQFMSTNEDHFQSKKQEYPMDAVLTLTHLNA